MVVTSRSSGNALYTFRMAFEKASFHGVKSSMLGSVGKRSARAFTIARSTSVAFL